MISRGYRGCRKSFGGAVALEGVESRRVEVETVSGSVTFDGALAADGRQRLEVKSFGGAVALEGVESRRVEVETVSGAVTFDGALAADGRYELRSHSPRQDSHRRVGPRRDRNRLHRGPPGSIDNR